MLLINSIQTINSIQFKFKIPCKDCAWNYIGETGRSLKTRKAEHIRNVKKHNSGSNIAKHAWDNDHVIDFDNAKVFDTGNFRSRLTRHGGKRGTGSAYRVPGSG